MDSLQFSHNLLSLRRERKLTQEELANFLGVTKASVSKWETGQSLPDIMLLPRLAAYFDTSVDRLLGYQPQLSKEQIRATYQRLAKDFANRPYEEVMDRSRELVKRYYSCYPFLLQICILWMNHYAGAKGKENEQLEAIAALCRHILENSKDPSVTTQAMSIKALADLQRGDAQAVIEALEEPWQVNTIEQSPSLLIQAYMIQGMAQKGEEVLQVELYRHLVQLISNQILFLAISAANKELCQEIMKRTDEVLAAFDFSNLNPNVTINYQFQAAIIHLGFGQEAQALDRLELYAKGVETLFARQLTLRGDSYFSRLDEWISDLTLGGDGVRDIKLVAKSAMDVFTHPAIQAIKDRARLELIMKKAEAACQIKEGEL